MQQIPMRFLLNPVHFLAIGFGSGCIPKAPGTMGSFVGILLYLIFQDLYWLYYLGLVLVMFSIGIWICDYTVRALDVPDHPAIVWDEIVGYLVTMIHAPSGWYWIFLGFILFRLFDIFKPWPIGFLDKHIKGGVGIMLDDVLAGIFSLTLVQLIAYIL